MSGPHGSSLTIRPATLHDVDEIHKLVVELATATGMHDKIQSTSDDFRRFGFSDPPAFHALVAEQDKRIVGLSLFFYEFSTWLGKPGVYIQDVVVRAEHRGKGLGRRLIAATVRVAEQHEANHLRLSVDANNAAAIRFYRAIGIDASVDERIFHAHGETFHRLGEAT
jgi:ribosomal protein S18 acetylase RimI-like enzyme